MTLEEVQKDMESQVQHVQLVSYEVERLRQQLAFEKKHVTETSMELQALKRELVKSKSEAEQLKSSEHRRQARSRSRLELEDAMNTINELKEELAYKSNVNRSLGLQLEKTIESNSELLLEIKDLDELLQAREAEIEVLTAGSGEKQGNEQLVINEQEAAWMQKLEDSEQEREELKRIITTLEESVANQLNEADTRELTADNEVLKKELEKAETEIAEASKENMNLLSQLMALRHQTEEKEVMVQQLVLQLNDLREKLQLSEELFQSQLDSNKGFLEDLNSTVEGLQARNEQLEHLLAAADKRITYLTEELDAQQEEILAHQKEKSLLGSQKGQLKNLREKIAQITESYEDAVKRGEELELANVALREENCIALAGLNGQLKDSEDKLHESSAECTALREKIEVAEGRARDADEQDRLLLGAKEGAEATISSLHAENAQLQKQVALLVEAKERGDASLSSLQDAHKGLQEQLTNAEYRSHKAFHQLQERMQDERASQYSCIQGLELEINRMKAESGASNKALFASEDKIQKLQLQNEDLSELLRSAMSFKEEVVSRLEAAIAKEDELYQKLQEAEQALHRAESEKATSDEALADLTDRVRTLEDERDKLEKATKGEEDKRRQHKGLQAQPNSLKVEKADTRKEKTKTSNDATIKLKRSITSFDGRELRLQQDASPKAGKKGIDIDQKSELMKLRKSAADLRRKVLEQEEEKEDMRKKLASIQKEAQRKSDLLISTERRLKEKEKEQQTGQRPPTRHSSNGSRRIGMVDSNAPYGAKVPIDLLEKVKSLEEELSIKSVELEATKFVLKEREAGLCSHSNTEKENSVNEQVDSDGQELPNKLEHLQNQDANSGEQHGLLINAGTQEQLLQQVKTLQTENRQLKKFLLTHDEEPSSDKSVTNMENDHPLRRGSQEMQAGGVDEGMYLQEELREMKERYSQMSLQFAELQVENDELLVTIKNLSKDSHK